MLIFFIVIVGLSLLILGHEAGHFVVAKLFGMKIDEFGFGFPPRIFAWRSKIKKGSPAKILPSKTSASETEYSFNWLPFGGFVRIAGENDSAPFEKGAGQAGLGAVTEDEKKRLFSFRPAWQRALVIIAGVTVNFIIGWLLVSAVLMVGRPKALIVSGTQPGSPAEKVGLMAGDIVQGYTTADSFISFVNQNRGREITLSVIRNGKELNFTAVPRENPYPGEGALGVAIAEGGEDKMGFLASLGEGLKRSLLISGLIFQVIYQLFQNLFLHGSLLQGVVGPVGIFSVAEEAGHIGLIYLVQLISLISLNLAVVNFIPFPALDGGRLLLIAVEKIKGSPLSRKVEGWANGLGFALLIIIMVLITIRDVAHLF